MRGCCSKPAFTTNLLHSPDSQDYGLSKTDFRHMKVLDLLDENDVKSLNSLKKSLGSPKIITSVTPDW